MHIRFALAVAGVAVAAITLAVSLVGPFGGPLGTWGVAGAASRREGHDPPRASALLRIARTFNEDYADNHDAAVYDRWDVASRAVISRSAFLRRHRDCPDPPEHDVRTWEVTRGSRGAWLVHYSVGGQQFVDYWYYVHGRFVFDLVRSNPSAVSLYRSSPAAYAKSVGCAGSGGA